MVHFVLVNFLSCYVSGFLTRVNVLRKKREFLELDFSDSKRNFSGCDGSICQRYEWSCGENQCRICWCFKKVIMMMIWRKGVLPWRLREPDKTKR